VLNLTQQPRQPRPLGCLVILGLCLFLTAALHAQTPDPTPLDAPQPGIRPPLTPFPRYEDWSFLRDPSLRVDPYDRLKFIPLNDSETAYLTLGLENRTEFQYLDNNNWGAGSFGDRSIRAWAEGMSVGHFPVRCGACASVCRPMPSAETKASRIH
jgi:hypothetical protein